MTDRPGDWSAAEAAIERVLAGRLAELGRPSQLGVRPTLERMADLLTVIGSPQVGLPVVHVGGTSGKGSTATFIAAILREAGLRVGLHVKPHLRSVRERIQLDGEPIEPAALDRLIDEVAPSARTVGPTWHELTTALAILAFRRAAVDVAVIEVGLGGTWDSTNLVEPNVVVLTNVGLDHTEVLGPTVEAIARDKVGIIKDGRQVVSGVTGPTTAPIVAARAVLKKAPLWTQGSELQIGNPMVGRSGGKFDLVLPGRTIRHLRVGMLGRHQIENAALAAAACWAFAWQRPSKPGQRSLGKGMVGAIRRGLDRARVGGRLERILTRPAVLLDGAHSPPKMMALRQALDDLFPKRPVVAVVASLAGHDLDATWAPIAGRFGAVVATTVDVAADYGPGRSIATSEVIAALRRGGFGGTAETEPDTTSALAKARRMAGPKGLVIVTGSLYLVGALRSL